MKLRVALVLLVLAIGSHLYLTNHYYQLSFGMGSGEAICNISKSFSCDTVSASRFSSLLGVPMAAWGAATNMVLLVLVFGWMIRWGDDLARLASYAFYLSTFTALTSVVMASISAVALRTYCLFCMATYLISFVVFELLRRSRPTDDARGLKDHLAALFGPAKNYVFILMIIPAGAFILNRGILLNYGAKDLAEFVATSIGDWQSSPEIAVTAPAMIKGSADADTKMTIVEWADFRCGHCRQASAPLAAFVASRTDVQLRFLNFPLDSACNPNIDSGDGVSCTLARAVMCADKLGQKGWDLHDDIFKDQEGYAHMNAGDLKNRLVEWGKIQSLDGETFGKCIEDESTRQIITEQVTAAKTAGVRGTPTILVNGKKLPRGQSLHVLEKAYEVLKQAQ